MRFCIIAGLPYYVAPDGSVYTVSLEERRVTIGQKVNKKPAGLLSEVSVRAKVGIASSIPAVKAPAPKRKRGKANADDT